MTIYRFTEEYRFLSNFWYAEVHMYGKSYPTAEHAFQAAKTVDPEEREKIRNAATPGQAKKLGCKVQLRPDWEEIKLWVMKTLVERKFDPWAHPELAQKLIDTGYETLIEGNYWHDTFWGVCECDRHQSRGTNNLGRILMEVRDELVR